MSDPFVGEIRMFAGTFAPEGWLACDGQLVPIATYDVLFALLGTTYGGDGQTTFALPDLRGRVPMGQGQGPGLSARTLGSAFGTESVTLTPPMAGHTHALMAAPSPGGLSAPAGNLLSEIPPNAGALYRGAPTNPVALAPASVSAFGGGAPHENRMPLLCVMFIIAWAGIFPARP